MFRFAKATSSDSIPRRSAGRRPVRTVWRWSRWAPAAEATSREGRIDGRSHGRTDERRAQAHPERAALLPRRLRPRGGRRLAEDQGAAPEAAVSRAVFRVAARAGPDRSLEPRGLEDDDRGAAALPERRVGRAVRRGPGAALQGVDLGRGDRAVGRGLPLGVGGGRSVRAPEPGQGVDRQGARCRRGVRRRGNDRRRLRARGALQARARIRGLMCGDWGAQTLVATKSARFAAVLVAARLGPRAYFPTL